MIETILLARKRKTGEWEALSKSSDEFAELKAKLHTFDQETHDDYDRIGVYQLVPVKKVLKLATKKEFSETKAKHAQMVKDGAEQQKLAELPLDKLQGLAKKFNVTISPRASKGELAAAVFTARNNAPAAPPLTPPDQEPEEFKDKTDDELRTAIASLNEENKKTVGKAQIAIAPDASRAHLISALIKATEEPAAKEPGFFGRLFGVKSPATA